ncbi:MAG: glycosyltransferase [Pirellulales bacterium]|nr:glycosyltransferase [Pirellulales bacterium]
MTHRTASTADSAATEPSLASQFERPRPGAPRLIIVNNGLKDCRGHHFETAVAVAESAVRFDLAPVMATHRDCPADLVPDWLPSYPAFRTEYWARPAGVRAQVRTLLDATLPRLPAFAADLVGMALDLRSAWRRSRTQRSAIDTSSRVLAQIGAEQAALQAFQDDLRALLRQLDVDASDHIYLPTAHGREVVAVRRLVDEFPAARCPVFHLEFRNPLFLGDSGSDDACRWSPAALECQAWFQRYRELGVSSRIALYTDAELLAAEYQRIAQLPFEVLPIPFRSRLLQPHVRIERTPLRLTFLGAPRDDKGFHWLPLLARRLWQDQRLRDQVELHFQASIASPSINPKSVAALRRLRRYPAKFVRLIGRKGPLLAEQYYVSLSQADVVLFPYEPSRYRAATSGTLTEALAAGKPCVVPAGTWLADQVPAGSGATFTDCPSFVEAVCDVVENYDSYRRRAAESARLVLATHTPDRLVEQFLQRAHGTKRRGAA